MTKKSAVQFDLTPVTLAAAAEAGAVDMFDGLHCAMLAWHGAGTYPTNAALVAALRQGYASNPRVTATDDTLTQYASGILKWSKAGKTPKRPTMSAFMGSVPGAKSTRGRPKSKGPSKPAEPDTLPAIDSIGSYLDFMRRMAAKINTIGLTAEDVGKISEPMLHCIALLDAAKKAGDKLAK